MATLATLRTGVTSKLGLKNSGAEQALVDDWLNQGILEILIRTQCTVEEGDMATIADVWKYQLDTDILIIRDMWREDSGGSVEPVVRVSEQEILQYRRGSASSNAAFTKYAVVGSNLLILWPTPSSVFTFDLLYVPKPTAMVAAGDDPSDIAFGRIPTEFHKAIEYYALWQGAEYDENRTAQGGERFRAMFEEHLKNVRASMQRKGGAQMPRAHTKAWRPGRSVYAHENDRY